MKRPYIPLAARLEAALRQLGLDPATAELDHDPALELRDRVPIVGPIPSAKKLTHIPDPNPSPIIGWKYFPDANDPRYLVWRSKAEHATKTNGPGNEKRITTRGGDHGDAAHLRRVTKKEAAFRARLLAKGHSARAADDLMDLLPDARPKKRKIASRGFQKRKKP